MVSQDLVDLIHELQFRIWFEFGLIFHDIRAIYGKFSIYQHCSVQLSRELEIDRADQGWYFGGMKIKTSITLSNEVLKAIDLYIGEYRSRSEFIETAARKFIAQLARKEAERRDLELINRHSDSLNAEAEDVLTYQAPL
jgi:Arc/MetJ-type ribon-helix-helix transcriptional regulator